MTEKDADVEWLRQVCGKQSCDPGLPIGRARRLLAHIDQLEARLIEPFPQIPRTPEYRPTVHEIAAQIYAPMMRGMEFAPWAVRFAEFAYTAAEALVAEGRRRDGNS